MHTREFPVLSRDDRGFVDRLAVGLGEDAARVLAYLLLREEREEFASDPASRLAIRVGTGMGRDATAGALADVEERELVAATTVESDTRGRPPKAWRARPADSGDAVARSHDHHADALLRQAREVAAALGVDAPGTDDGACGGVPASARSTPDEPARLRIGLNWRPNGLHAPLFAAAAEGAYADRGVNVSFEHHRGSRRALESVASGDTDVGIAGAATLLRARASDGRADGPGGGESEGDETGATGPVVPIALLFQRATTTLYTVRDAFGGEFRSAEQLRGRRVGMPRGSETGVLGRLFLSQAAVLDDVHVVDTGGEEREALLSGRADAVTGSFSDPRRLEADGFDVDSVLVADHFPMCGPALIVRPETLAEREALLARFLAGTMDGLAFAMRRPAVATTTVVRGDDVPGGSRGGVEGHEADDGNGDGESGDSDPEPDARAERERRTFERAIEEFGASEAVGRNGWGWQRVEAWNRLETALGQGRLLGEEP